MNMLKFSDGIDVDTSGELRTLQLHDGWYVTGEGFLSPTDNEKEALRQIDNIKKRREEKTS